MPRPSASALPSLTDDMRGIQDLIARKPSAPRVQQHVERLAATWRERLDPDAYAERQDAMHEALRDGVEHLAEAAGAEGGDFATADPAGQAKADAALLRVALDAVEREALVGAV